MRFLLSLLIIFACTFSTPCIYSYGNDLPKDSSRTAVKPLSMFKLDEKVHETSGLIYFDNSFFTINDSGNENILYRISATSGSILAEIKISNAENIDWEELTQDENYIYIADIGNNSRKREEKQIYRLKKSEVMKIKKSGKVESEVIRFKYPEIEGKKVNFDAEALIVYDGVLHLFTKDFFVTNHFTISKEPGVTTARFIENYQTNGQVTGAAFDPIRKTLVMVGYRGFGQRMFWEFKHFDDRSLVKSTARYFTLGTSKEAGQVEAVCFDTGGKVFITNENFGGLQQQLWNLPYPVK